MIRIGDRACPSSDPTPGSSNGMRRPVTSESIRQAASSNGVALLPFVAAGYPNLQTTVETLMALDDDSIGAIEIGFPFSDPIADGPVIQEAFNHALNAGLKVNQIFDAIADAKSRIVKPLVAMVSYSIVFRYGLDRFLSDAKRAGFSAMLFPDLPPPEAQTVCDKVRAAGLDTVLLVAPTSTASRRAEIARLCSGFVYYLSVSGITGERTALPADLVDNVRQLKSVAKAPVCIGFGISQKQHIDQLRGVGDGAIIGSAIVRRIHEHLPAQPAQLAKAVADYCRGLLA
jgi:tryptophan synthase alpha chain